MYIVLHMYSYTPTCVLDWNTATDEEVLSQLKDVSTTALACYLYHCGLSDIAISHTGKPTRQLIDVYKGVFSLRKEVFLHRPLPDTEGSMVSYMHVHIHVHVHDTCSCIFVKVDDIRSS